MPTWTSDELNKIDGADELEIASERADGSLRNPVTIWVVRHGDDLYVRSWHGRGSAWFRGMQERHAGHIKAGGGEKDVTFTEVHGDHDLDAAIDAAYRAKYRHYSSSIVDPMVAPQARAATIKLTPRS